MSMLQLLHARRRVAHTSRDPRGQTVADRVWHSWLRTFVADGEAVSAVTSSSSPSESVSSSLSSAAVADARL